MNTRNRLKPYTLTLCLLLSCSAATARTQSKQKEKPGAAQSAQSAATPTEVVRAYYTALREGRVRDAMLMSWRVAITVTPSRDATLNISS